MKIIEYFTSDDKAHWLGEIAKADWGAAKFLHQLLSEGKLKETLGDSALVPLLTDGEKLVSFCTFAPLDDVQPTELSPWIGFVYTAPEYRGHRYVGEVLNWAESVATVMGREVVYISTDHTGLYEKYGYEFFRTAKSVGGEKTRIYRKELSADGEEKQKCLANGGRWKAQIVEAAKQGVDMTAICGLSCAHCFLGEWCGGCRSVFNCYSFGTMFPGGKCPNVKCCKEKILTAALTARNSKNAKKDSTRQATTEPPQARHRQSSSVGTEKKPTAKFWTTCTKNTSSKKCRKYSDRAWKRELGFWKRICRSDCILRVFATQKLGSEQSLRSGLCERIA